MTTVAIDGLGRIGRAILMFALIVAPGAAARGVERSASPPGSTRWTEADGRPTRQARAAIAALRAAAARGLRPRDYDADSLGAWAARLAAPSTASRPGDAAAFDSAVSRAVLRFLTHLHLGRVDPRRVGHQLSSARGELDLPALLAEVSRADDVAAVIASAEPKYAGYRALIDALPRYQAFGADSAKRVRQLELTLERWRWLPDAPPARYLVVNIPAFLLYAFEDDPVAAHPALRMDVIVGRANGAHDTPVFSAPMREVVFRPYWNVPQSIARAEMVPRIRRESGYFAAQDLEIVGADDDDGPGARAVEPNAANLARVAGGTLRLRQRPGPRNALGPVKFLFPNAHDVYLHSTPARELFDRTRRDFSHGCVRVADPAALAAFVLDGQPGWDRAAIETAMSDRGARSRRVSVARPLQVFLLYATAVQEDDGVLHFYPDVYGHDARLAQALGM
jgi:murein L,D-transpeptidase YcbB/YkuD